jgi:hypothetical protein
LPWQGGLHSLIEIGGICHQPGLAQAEDSPDRGMRGTPPSGRPGRSGRMAATIQDALSGADPLVTSGGASIGG